MSDTDRLTAQEALIMTHVRLARVRRHLDAIEREMREVLPHLNEIGFGLPHDDNEETDAWAV